MDALFGLDYPSFRNTTTLFVPMSPGWSAADCVAALLSGWGSVIALGVLAVATIIGVTISQRVATAADRRDSALEDLTRRFDTTLSNISQGLCLYDADDRLLVANARFAEIFGFPPEKIRPGMPFDQVLRLGIAAGHFPGRQPDAVLWERLSYVNRRVAGTVVQELPEGRAVSVSHRPTEDGGWLATYEDITEARRAEQRLVYLARHDSLTGLPNRTNFNERLEWAITQVGRGASIAIMYVDVDRFRNFNDTYGHVAGDALLQSVAQRLQFCVRESDVVARLCSDEFAILQVGPDRAEDSSVLAQRIIREMRLPHDVHKHPAMASVSLGISLAPADGTLPARLIQQAEEAMYRAKADGAASFRMFEPETDARLQSRRLLEQDLRSSLAQAQFELHYQPLYNLRSGRISGYEALLRWNHPTRGMVHPADFIPVAEESGLIVPIGEWVMRHACAQAAGWAGNARVAVNLSPVQFKSRTLKDAVVTALAASGLPPVRLDLEVTETLMLDRTESALDLLREFRLMGIRVAMDDFGTGYSSLSYLRDFPFDKIKIDRSFIKDLLERRECLAIVRAVISLAESLGIGVVAEGVQNDEQLATLRDAGCDEAQSFLLGRPMPAREIPFHLAKARHAA